MLLKYNENCFNYLWRITEYFYENTEEQEVKKNIQNLWSKIEANHFWYTEGGLSIILDLNEADISIIFYVYENIIFFTYEARAIMNKCDNVFKKLLEKDSTKKFSC